MFKKAIIGLLEVITTSMQQHVLVESTEKILGKFSDAKKLEESNEQTNLK